MIVLCEGETALGFAAKNGKPDCMELFIRHGAPLNVKNKDAPDRLNHNFSLIYLQ